MIALAPWLNAAWRLSCVSEARAFARATANVAVTQRAILREILDANRDTEFGRAHGFGQITSPREYQERVPPATYDNFAPSIERIAAGETNVLTREPVVLLEPTSGTTGGEKLIPYTASLRKEFQRGIAAWIANLFSRRPAAGSGRAYWSISPALGAARKSDGGIPIGFDEDTAYLGRLAQWALRRLLVVPSSVARLSDIQAVRYATLRLLLAADDLSLISVWNPTFLTSLFASLREWRDELVDDLRRQSAKRADQVRSVLRSAGPAGGDLHELWPRLALVSCWTDAGAAQFIPQLRRWLPQVEIQPKGLLATEGFVSLPLVDQEAPALAVRSHFFEFESSEVDGQFHLAHELERGGKYRVALTTGGGLYRYRLGDEIEVVGHYHECPLLRFLGKSDRVCDLVGEKLAEAHVQSVLNRLFAARGLTPSFSLLAPVLGAPPRYRLYVQGVDQTALDSLAPELQSGLEENPYYRHAVSFGQLSPVEVERVVANGRSAWSLYEEQCLARGQRCGDIKPAALDRWLGWPGVFG